MVNGGFATCKFAICTVRPSDTFAERDFATWYLHVSLLASSQSVFSPLIRMRVVSNILG